MKTACGSPQTASWSNLDENNILQPITDFVHSKNEKAEMHLEL
jgi:hypothetical protein